MAPSPGLSPAYRKTIGRALAELDMLRKERTDWVACNHNAWTALRMIREAVETLGPRGALRSEEAVLGTLGPEPIREGAGDYRGHPCDSWSRPGGRLD